jgi:hypothetical protein
MQIGSNTNIKDAMIMGADSYESEEEKQALIAQGKVSAPSTCCRVSVVPMQEGITLMRLGLSHRTPIAIRCWS